jgi:iron(II)-dependent oxidoreductase
MPNDPLLITLKDGIYSPGPDADQKPMDAASFAGAQRYCEWAGKRLPSEAEFEFATRHDPVTKKDLRYPWGDRFEKNRANCLDDDCADGFPDRAPVGTFDGTNGHGDDASPSGMHDATGNADEMLADCYAPYVACTDACPGSAPSHSDTSCIHAMRPGNFARDRKYVTASARGRGNHGGFRCARN